MKKIGIIGGAGPLASVLLYETLILESYALKGEIPEIVLINYPFTRGLSFEEGKKNQETILSELSYCVEFLRKNRVEIAILACNTLHLFLSSFLSSSIQFHSIPQMVVNAAKSKQHSRLLILGTENTCRSHLYQSEELYAIYPSADDQMIINQIIDRVLDGKILQKDASLVSQMIENTLKKEVFDGVVLGCTDFPVLHHRFAITSPKPIYDSIKIPAKTLIGLL